MELIKKNKPFLLLIIVFAIVYFVNFIAFAKGTDVFRVERNDVLFSIDSNHFINKMYNPSANEHVGSIVRHPLIANFGKIVSNFALIITDFLKIDLTQMKLYSVFAGIQILLGALSVGVIYQYATKIINISNINALMISILYGLSTSNLIFTMAVDSFIISGFLLILGAYTVYMKNEEKMIRTQALIGVFTIGVTITNGALWFINLVVAKFRTPKVLLRICVYFICIFLPLFLIQSSSSEIATNFLGLTTGLADRFSTDYTFLDIMRKTFYFIFVAPLFFIFTEYRTPFQTEITERGITFIENAPIVITITGILWLAFLIISIVISVRNKKVWPLIFSIIFFLLIHAIKQFGLREAFLYSQHILYAQVLLAGWGIKYFEKYKRTVISALVVLLGIQMFNNFFGLISLHDFCSNILKLK